MPTIPAPRIVTGTCVAFFGLFLDVILSPLPAHRGGASDLPMVAEPVPADNRRQEPGLSKIKRPCRESQIVECRRTIRITNKLLPKTVAKVTGKANS